MIERDYIKRLINELTKFLSYIVFNRKKMDWQEAQDQLEDACKELLGMDYSVFALIEKNEIFKLLKNDSSAGIKFYILGRLFYEDALNKSANNSDTEKILKLKDNAKYFLLKAIEYEQLDDEEIEEASSVLDSINK